MTILKPLIAITAMALALSVPMTSLTASKISSVSLKISSEIGAGDSGSDAEVATSSGKYDVSDTEVTNEPDDEWEDGDKPKLKVALTTDDDYTFAPGLSKSDVGLSGDDGKMTSVNRSSDELVVYITLDALDGDDGDYDLGVSGLEWSEYDGTADWDEAEDMKRYEVRLYRRSSTVTSVLTTSDTSYNFSSYITKDGSYTFKVWGVYNASYKEGWEESDSWYVSSDGAEEISAGSSLGSPSGTSDGAWLRDDVGWWYCNADKSYTVSNWQYINGYWYYSNECGCMVTGWVSWNSQWHYCNESGVIFSGTTTPDGYYVGGDGAWVQ